MIEAAVWNAFPSNRQEAERLKSSRFGRKLLRLTIRLYEMYGLWLYAWLAVPIVSPTIPTSANPGEESNTETQSPINLTIPKKS